MENNKPIIQQTPPNLAGQASVHLNKDDFDAAIELKGYRVWHDRAIKCPCSSKDGGSAQSTCRNCNGSGWLYVNRTETKMVVQSMNTNTKYSEWSEERLGTANITARHADKLSFMDRITLLDSESEYNQVVFLKKQPDSNMLYGAIRYEPVEIYSIFMYVSTTQPLKLLEEGTDYVVEGYMIKLTNVIYNQVDNPTITIRYKHNVEYTILDIPRDVMVSKSKGCGDNIYDGQFPINAIGRKSHYVIDRNDYSGVNLIDNSFEGSSYSEQYDTQYR